MTEKIEQTFAMLPLDDIRPNPDQPRKHFDVASLESLSVSIKEHGVLNPIAVKGPYQEGSREVYFIVDGERRWRASKEAGKETIPAYIRPRPTGESFDDKHKEDTELALIGNLQREDMNPVDEGAAFKKLSEFGYTQNQISAIVGKSVTTIISRMKITEMEPEIQKYFSLGYLGPDIEIVNAIAQLPADLRVKVATRLGAKRSSRKTVLMVCSRIARNQGYNSSVKRIKKASSPAMSYSEEPNSRLFDTLAKEGKTPPWSLIETAAKETCEACALMDSASDQVCKDCPAVELIKRITEAVADGNHPSI